MAWQLEYVELSTQFGKSNAVNVVVLLPGSAAIQRPTAALVAAAWLALTALLLLPPFRPHSRVLRVAHRAIAPVSIGLFALCGGSSLFTTYNVVLSWDLFFRLMVALMIWRLIAAVQWIGGVKFAQRLAIASVVFTAYAVLMGTTLRDVHHGHYSGFLQIDRKTFDRNPLFLERPDVRAQLQLTDAGGYDGEFMYFAAFDPFMLRFRQDVSRYRDVMDAAPYRFGRIGYSLLAKAVSLNTWQWYPPVMMWMVLLAMAGSAFAVSAIAQRQGLSAGWGLTVVLIPGFWQSLQMGLPEPIAAALMLGGVFCLLGQRWVAAGLLCGLSLLVRETGVIFIVCLGLGYFVQGKRGESLQFASFALVPLMAWRLYVGAKLYPAYGTAAFFFNPNDVTVPFGGFAELLHRVRSGTYYAGNVDLARAALTYPPLLILALIFSVVAAMSRRQPIAIAGITYGLLAISLNYTSIWVHVGNGQRGTFELFVALMLVSVSPVGSSGWLRWVRGVFWAAAAAYVFYGAFDAPSLRNALFSLVW